MARNSAGTHSLPSTTNPVVTNTNITPTWANGTLQDVSAEITDSLSRSGKGGMTAPLRTADGTVAAPAQAFTSETGSGWFRHAAGELRLAILGVYRIAATATLTTINSAASVLGTLTASGKITAQAGADVTGTLAVVDDGGTSKMWSSMATMRCSLRSVTTRSRSTRCSLAPARAPVRSTPACSNSSSTAGSHACPAACTSAAATVNDVRPRPGGSAAV